MSRILVTGGAGYVGSHIVRHLVESGREVVVLDDFSAGHRTAVLGVDVVEGDFGDPTLLDRVLDEQRVTAIVHMAGSCLVGQSMTDPGLYYRNNFTKTYRPGGVTATR